MRRLLTRAAGLAAALLFASAPAVSAAVQPDLVGGQPSEKSYPFMVSLSTDDEHYCGASVIRPEWMITAAHCVDGYTADQLTARVGSADRTEGGEVAQPTKLVAHPSYTGPGSTADLALIKLRAPVEAEPIDLAEKTEPGTQTRLLGWGQTCAENGCGDSPKKLQELDTRIVDGERCASGFSAKTEVCTGNPDNSGACYGDSGGPQVVRSGDRWRLIGMSSRAGNDEPVCGTAPSIYTSAPAYSSWIDETTGT